MKKHLLLVFLFPCMSCFAQPVYFEPVIVDACAENVTLEEAEWYVTDETNQAVRQNEGSAGIWLHPGTYYLHTDNDFSGGTYFYVKGDRVIRDTFRTHKLVMWHEVSPSHGFTYCDEPAEGYLEDHYFNGNVRIRGNFNLGKPVDSLFEYYPNGKLKQMSLEKERRFLSYDTTGNLVCDWNIGKGYRRTFTARGIPVRVERDNQLEKYDENGTCTLRVERREKVRMFNKSNAPWVYRIKRFDEVGSPVYIAKMEMDKVSGASALPETAEEIGNLDLKRITFYRRGVLLFKLVPASAGRYIRYLKPGNKWQRDGTLTEDEFQALLINAE